ncbi:MAG: hypothetical protein K0Q66_301 [Chitinophagaceae bacterium]|nr:hypothetical protein [Chitinophagaceae bacterium]
MNMHLQVKEGISLWNLQKQFTDVFPFLKLEFFRSSAGAKKVPSREEILKPGEAGSDLSKAAGAAVDINIDKHMTVASLEEEFRRKAGLGVQVFRKSGNVWIATSLTSDWTLEQQNREGESLSDH